MARIVSGIGLILLGIALLALPGPGFLTILAGVTLLANEFTWASAIKEWAIEKTALLLGEKGRSSDTAPDEERLQEDQIG